MDQIAEYLAHDLIAGLIIVSLWGAVAITVAAWVFDRVVDHIDKED